ncbi:MAG: hypothetical protein MHM6MM_006261 [Cercozoa sp. M6MM]
MAKEWLEDLAVTQGLKASLELEPLTALKSMCAQLPKEIEQHATVVVADLGAGTADVCALKVLETSADGAPTKCAVDYADAVHAGGTDVDKACALLLESVFGQCWSSRTTNLDKVAIASDFEIKKANYCGNKLVLNLSRANSLLDAVSELTVDERDALMGRVTDLGEGAKFNEKRARLTLPADTVTQLFAPTVEKIINFIERVHYAANSDVAALFVTGGFSQSSVVCEALRASLGDVDLLQCARPRVAVAHGAVLLSLHTEFVFSRRMHRTYGKAVYVPFNPHQHHDASAASMVSLPDGSTLVATFHTFVRKGEEVEDNYTTSVKTRAPSRNQRHVDMLLLSSENTHPKYAFDSDVDHVRTWRIEATNTSLLRLKTSVSFGASVCVRAEQEGSIDRVNLAYPHKQKAVEQAADALRGTTSSFESTGATKVDLAFLVDCTGSMGPYIDGVKNKVQQAVREVQRACQKKIELRVAFVGYRDYK